MTEVWLSLKVGPLHIYSRDALPRHEADCSMHALYSWLEEYSLILSLFAVWQYCIETDEAENLCVVFLPHASMLVDNSTSLIITPFPVGYNNK